MFRRYSTHKTQILKDISHLSPSVGAVFEPQSERLVPPAHEHQPRVTGRPERLRDKSVLYFDEEQ